MRIGNDPLDDAIPAIPAGWPATLKDDWAIAEYVVENSPGEVDVEFVRENFRFGTATLAMVPIADIRPGSAEGNVRVASRERKYAKMDPATMPPLLIEDGEIKDGHHRYRIALKRGDEHLPCYVVEYPD